MNRLSSDRRSGKTDRGNSGETENEKGGRESNAEKIGTENMR